MSDRELDKLLDICRSSGCTVNKTPGGHWQVLPSDKSLGVITVSSSPSDHRAYAKIRSQLRKAGMNVPYKGGV